jgi:hypothetical protein
MSNTTPFGYPIPTARQVSPLRQRMIEDMTVRNFAPNTQVSYLHQVNLFARHFDCKTGAPPGGKIQSVPSNRSWS